MIKICIRVLFKLETDISTPFLKYLGVVSTVKVIVIIIIYYFSVLTFLPSLIWAICLGALEAQSCWMVDIHGFQWIVDSFRITILAINIILLLDIVRVMLLKLKRKSTTKQTM